VPALIIESAMVNPRGKSDRLGVAVPNELLNEEWVQIRNQQTKPFKLDGIELMHLVYRTGGKTEQSLVMKLMGTLPPGASLRIHSGRGKPYVDPGTNIYHGYVNPKSCMFLFQVLKPDKIFLTMRGKLLDVGGYGAPVPVNRRLKRATPIEKHILSPV